MNLSANVMKEPLAIFAGRGLLPKILIEDCQKKQRRFLLFLLDGENYEIDYSAFNPIKLRYGEVEKFLSTLKENNIKNIVFIGGVTKPNFSALKVDKRGALLLAKILANKILGDDAVLRTVIKFFEKEGLKILAIDQLLDCVISTKSTITVNKPTSENLSDIALGVKAIKNFSQFDVGQSLVIAQKQIIAVEALEGTDQMIKRCKDLSGDYLKNSVLVKMKKSKQSLKADLPTIGVETIKNCFEAKICGIAIQANSTLVLQKDQVIKKANELGLFLTVI
ncbi:MAG: UDP-2,3-diacylglucosamine diphosphatase LpxI [Rickettsiales bacterium]|nr:UDP-2,3-diacylglucosamine diphosphatase LpxI [Rickettsiales bacterium]